MDANQARPSPWTIAAVLLVAVLPAAYFAWTYRDLPHLGASHDDSLYWVTAKSLAEGSGYRLLSLPDQPPQTKYPPLFSLFLSLFWRLNPSFPGNTAPAVAACWLMLPLYLLSLRLLFRDLGLGWTHTFVLWLLLAWNQNVLFYSISFMPELMFSALLIVCLHLSQAASRPGASRWTAGAAGALAGVTFLVKSAILPLLATAPVFFLLRRRLSRALLFAACMLPAVAVWTWWVRVHVRPSADFIYLYYTNYVGYYLHNISPADLPSVIAKNFDRLLWALGGFLADCGPDQLGHSQHLAAAAIGWRILAVIAILGTVRMARRTGLTQYHLFAAGFLALLVSWHYTPNERLIFPVYPLLLAGFSSEVCRIANLLRAQARARRLAARAPAFAFSAAFVVCAVAGAYLLAYGLLRTQPGFLNGCRILRASNRQAYEWIGRNLPDDAAFLAYDDPVLYLYTGRRGFRLSVSPKLFYHTDMEGFDRMFGSLDGFARDHRLNYILAAATDFHGEVIPQFYHAIGSRGIIRSNPGFREIYRAPLTSVYELKR
jgi:hypothetical protein